MGEGAVLDASALLILLNAEPGADEVRKLLPGAFVSAANLAEVVGKLADAGMPPDAIRRAVDLLAVEVVPFDGAQAHAAGLLRPATRAAGLSLGDRACMALAAQLGVPAITADRTWRRIRAGVSVRVIGR